MIWIYIIPKEISINHFPQKGEMVEPDGIEPTTWSLQSYRSPNWAKAPFG